MVLVNLLANVWTLLSMASILSMPPRKWASRRRTQSGHSEDCEQPMEIDDFRHAHDSLSDDAIDNANQLEDRIAHSNEVMRECRTTFGILEIRNARLTMKLKALRDRLTIPTWDTGAGARSSQGDANMQPANPPLRTFLDNPPPANPVNQFDNRPLQYVPPSGPS